MTHEFWNQYAPYYSKITLSPVYGALVKDTLMRAAIRGGEECFDLGSGPGYIARALYDRGATVRAVEYSDAMMALARKFFKKCYGGTPDRIHLIPSEVNEFLSQAIEQGQRADVVVASLLLSYVDDWDRAAKNIYKVLRPGGRLVMSNPVPGARFGRVFLRSGWNALRYLWFAVRILSYARQIKKTEAEGRFHFFSETETRELLVGAGFPKDQIEITTSFAGTVYLTCAVKT